MCTTPLRRQLAGASARPTALDALDEATRMFQAGQRIDMRALAGTLKVDRATLYRWVGSREQLLAEVLWSMLDKTIAKLRDAAGEGPVAAGIVTGAATATMANTGMRAFLEREGDLALRLLTTKASAFQQRLVARIAEVVDHDRQAGHLHSTVPDADLPYVLVRIMESYVYLSLITGDEPDATRASSVIHALLPGR
ncbi:QsdR family transcriptional regulator [Umezawaea sp. Da 62-37]|uniref:QsdR family transcriptional regulator n=1 Tax=Umezawaea sp. Da 62-37 TaxID=3075927 RepID=UPI0028F70140|nr:QsdR family transcriptional regulator [Umezawaea sp. Da 62-37]WNV88031.1 QsdR family transcriptional regulator [Umezawaea sp. Da 62-37]